ncbi:helix-turn-helix domain-containing protein [Taklimakanibacter lacteus]|uniref:helix-turn-helix domain-containing protein n=1 Tax=Taklimakanibacter lacteus TaxID=2268456 RepID=UPI0034D3C39A
MILDETSIDARISGRLKDLRLERGWSLDDLATLSGVSRATLSRLENSAISPTTSMLSKLCAAYGLTMSRLMHMAEGGFVPLVRRGAQAIWTDAAIGFRRRAVSPPAQTLAGEVIEGELGPGTRIAYDEAPKPGLEHHLLLLEGQLEITVGGQTHDLKAGDCLRYQLFGPSAFATPKKSSARYLIFMV